jgi:hypothetical protein
MDAWYQNGGCTELLIITVVVGYSNLIATYDIPCAKVDIAGVESVRHGDLVECPR